MRWEGARSHSLSMIPTSPPAPTSRQAHGFLVHTPSSAPALWQELDHVISRLWPSCCEVILVKGVRINVKEEHCWCLVNCCCCCSCCLHPPPATITTRAYNGAIDGAIFILTTVANEDGGVIAWLSRAWARHTAHKLQAGGIRPCLYDRSPLAKASRDEWAVL